ncbi:MAG TPA: substrate-binding domain-containing protein [Xanthobacteraceae bacterium]|jgi:iron(III) transport system substrate-binding protein|nr:substrate-binding domain-containing protein [Xanthobacteraceae bacterium]
MRDRVLSRRDVLKASTALAASTIFAAPLRAALPEPTQITPALIEAARKEGRVSFYSALEINTSTRFAKAFEAKYPGISVRVERSGAERIFQRIGQERSSQIHAVDVVISTNPAHFLSWKKDDLLAPFVTNEMAQHYDAEHIEADGMYATVCAWLGVIGYNKNLVKPEDAPKRYADLLDPKWKGKLVKGHPAYSGAILTTTYVIIRDLGWPYLEKLAQQKVMQVQSSVEPPKKIAIGERAVQADGNDYNLLLFAEEGHAVEVVYPEEGSALITTPSGIFRSAPNPNAARLFQSFMFSAEAQQLFIDAYAHRSFHALTKERPGQAPLSSIKLLKSDPAEVEAQSEMIKTRYAKLFGV